MLNIVCNFTRKSLGVAVVVSEVKLEVSREGSKSIKRFKRFKLGQQPTREVCTYSLTMTISRYDDDIMMVIALFVCLFVYLLISSGAKRLTWKSGSPP